MISLISDALYRNIHIQSLLRIKPKISVCIDIYLMVLTCHGVSRSYDSLLNINKIHSSISVNQHFLAGNNTGQICIRIGSAQHKYLLGDHEHGKLKNIFS
jgi:hypothetical protein